MLHNLYPDLQLERIGQIDFAALKQSGICGLLLDIDNTLVSYQDRSPTEEVLRFLNAAISADLAVALVSNNSRRRVEIFAQGLGIPYLHRAHKPMRYGYLSLANQLGLAPQQIAVVGDQIFTDVYGGNRCGMFTILVNPIAAKESGFFRFKRHFEKKVLKQMKKKRGVQ